MSKTKDHGPQIKDDELYEELRKEGNSKEKAARIANAAAAEGRSSLGKRGGSAKNYEDRTKAELYAQAKKLKVEGRSKMSKQELISALREG